MKGTIQPACRNASGEIQYRIEGNLVTVKDNGEERGMCDGVDSTGQSYCDLDVDKINLRFWGGQACQSAILEVTQDTFEGFVSSREITDPSVYYFTHYDDFSLHTILFGLRHEDRFDRPSPTEKPAFTLSGNVVKVIPQAVGPASLPVGLLHPLCEPPMELAKRKITMNFLEVLPTSPDLPECIAPAPIPPVIK
ncbi:MAG TPA: hypothetical protein VFX30_00740 [bacterium]|nr:hypothetical protein [bacterium]